MALLRPLTFSSGERPRAFWALLFNFCCVSILTLINDPLCRRLKKEVLTELPDKIRQLILLDPSSIKVSRELKTASKVMTSADLKVCLCLIGLSAGLSFTKGKTGSFKFRENPRTSVVYGANCMILTLIFEGEDVCDLIYVILVYIVTRVKLLKKKCFLD